MKALAVARGGKCLSDEYVNIDSKLKWQCSHGHEWEAIAYSIKSGKSWCPTCSGKARWNDKDIRELAKQQNLECLSLNISNCDEQRLWKCLKCNDEFKSSLTKTRLRQTGCPRCGNRRKRLSDLQEAAKARGGILLSTQYLGMLKKHEWQCGTCNTRWWAKPNNIISSNTWCPHCALQSITGTGERLALTILEESGLIFKKIRPSWLMSENGNPLELDGYCSERRIAVEYNGKIHYRYIPYFHSTRDKYNKVRRRDSVKRKICSQHGIMLIQIPEVHPPTESNIRAALVDYCIRNAIPLELNPEYAEMLTLPNYGLDSED